MVITVTVSMIENPEFFFNIPAIIELQESSLGAKSGVVQRPASDISNIIAINKSIPALKTFLHESYDSRLPGRYDLFIKGMLLDSYMFSEEPFIQAQISGELETLREEYADRSLEVKDYCTGYYGRDPYYPDPYGFF